MPVRQLFHKYLLYPWFHFGPCFITSRTDLFWRSWSKEYNWSPRKWGSCFLNSTLSILFSSNYVWFQSWKLKKKQNHTYHLHNLNNKKTNHIFEMQQFWKSTFSRPTRWVVRIISCVSFKQKKRHPPKKWFIIRVVATFIKSATFVAISHNRKDAICIMELVEELGEGEKNQIK